MIENTQSTHHIPTSLARRRSIICDQVAQVIGLTANTNSPVPHRGQYIHTSHLHPTRVTAASHARSQAGGARPREEVSHQKTHLRITGDIPKADPACRNCGQVTSLACGRRDGPWIVRRIRVTEHGQARWRVMHDQGQRRGTGLTVERFGD